MDIMNKKNIIAVYRQFHNILLFGLMNFPVEKLYLKKGNKNKSVYFTFVDMDLNENVNYNYKMYTPALI